VFDCLEREFLHRLMIEIQQRGIYPAAIMIELEVAGSITPSKPRSQRGAGTFAFYLLIGGESGTHMKHGKIKQNTKSSLMRRIEKTS